MSKPKLLLHVCCAPCFLGCFERLINDYNLSLYFYNPNIYPQDEHDFREDELKRLINENSIFKDIDIIEAPKNTKEWYALIKGREEDPERGQRCTLCFDMRLQETFEAVTTHNFDHFATTLTLSPHKNSNILNQLGAKIDKKTYLPSNFKKQGGMQISTKHCQDHNIYRQNYCGCEFSYKNMQAREK